MKDRIKGFILGTVCTIILTGITVYATSLISGSYVSFDNSNTGLTSTNVSDALDELYMISESHCPTGYICKEKPKCDYAINHAWRYEYNGGSQEFTVPCEGLYKLEVYGAKGGNGWGSGGYGGYSVGYVALESNDKLYVTCGGAGGTSTAPDWNNWGSYISGGYNGGGGAVGPSYDGPKSAGAGGGATHISTAAGVLSNASVRSGLLIAAGGGGGGGWTAEGNATGGAGGGVNGSGGYGGSGVPNGSGGSQTTGGCGESCGGAGYGASESHHYPAAGGGGGFYGGGSGYYYNGASAGGGGSGFIAGVPEITYNGTKYTPSSSNGNNNGNGRATITLIALPE